MDTAWNYWQANGAMTNADYPYKNVDQNCMHDSSSSDLTYPQANGQITTNITDAANQLRVGPMTVAVAAGNSCWRYYKGGVVGTGDDCGATRIDHAVTLVAYTEVAAGTETCEDVTTESCRRASRNEKKAGQCNAGDFDVERDDSRGNFRYCCDVTTTNVCTSSGGSAFWTIQNSWDTDWGLAGFMHM